MKTKQLITMLVILLAGIAIGKLALPSNKEVQDNHLNETIEEHWTCSMHPQIDLPEFGQCPICGMDLILKSSAGEDETTQSPNSFKMTKNAIALANIETTLIGGTGTEDRFVTPILNITGKITANKKQISVQTTHFGGRVERLYYKSEGEFVKRGSLIASIYSPELVTAQNEYIEALEIKNTQPELYKAIRNKLKNWKILERQIEQLERDKKVITNFNIYANVSGYIGEIFIEEGDYVKEGTPLFQVANLSTVWANFDVYEQDVKYLKAGQMVTIKLNAFPDDIIKAKIDFVDPVLDTKTRTITVRATLKNKSNKFKPGMLLSGKISLENAVKKDIVKIPKTAVLWTGKRSVVYVKIDKNKPVFEMREISLGSEFDEFYKVLSGLNNGEEIVVNGTFTVDAAAQLLGKKSMMNKRAMKMTEGHQGH